MARTLENLKKDDDALVSLVSETLGNSPKKGTGRIYKVFHANNDDKNPSFQVWKNGRGFSDWTTGKHGSIVDFTMYYIIKNDTQEGLVRALNWLTKKFNLETIDKTEFIKQPKRIDLFENFEKFRINEFHSGFNRFLQNRGVDFQFIGENSELIEEIAKEFGYFKGLYIGNIDGEDIYKDVVISPVMDSDKNIIGGELRTISNEYIYGKKSIHIKGGKGGLLFNKISSEYVLLCEGMPDYITLKILGYKSIICNLNGCTGNIDKIGDLIKNTKRVISFYDNDVAGQKANELICKKLGRNIRKAKFPKIDGILKFDVNDLYKMKYNKSDFDKMIKQSEEINIKNNNINDTDIKEDKNGYSIVKEFKEKVYTKNLTNFKIEIQDILIYEKENEDDEERLVLKLYDSYISVEGEFTPKQFTNASAFAQKVGGLKSKFSTYGITGKELEELRRYIFKGSNIIPTMIVDKYGFITKYNIRVLENGICKDGEFFEYNENKTADLGEIKIKLSAKENSLYWQEDEYYNIKNIEKLDSDLIHMFSGKQGLLVLGFLISTIFVNDLPKILKPFPILFVQGKKATGKTTAINFVLKTLGFEYSADNFESTTKFILQDNLANYYNLPYWLDEYKNGPDAKSKDGLLKSVFDRNGISKGQKDLTKKHYPINASLILSGEESPIDDAVLSRSLLINVKKKTNDNGLFDEIILRSDYYGSLFRYILENYKREKLLNRYEEIFKISKKILSKNKEIGKRLINVYLPGIVGYILYREIIEKKEKINEEIIKITEDYIDKMLEKKQDEIENDIVNEFFDIIAIDYEDNDWSNVRKNIDKNVNGIIISFENLYSIYKKNVKYGDRVITKAALRGYLQDEYDCVAGVYLFGITGEKKQKRGLLFPNISNLPTSFKELILNIDKDLITDFIDLSL